VGLINFVMIFVKYLFIVALGLFFVFGCSQSGRLLSNEITLIKTSPGGGRAHVIYISRDGSYTYKIVAISDLDSFDGTCRKDTTYKEMTGKLTQSQRDEIQDFMSQASGIDVIRSNDIIKDAWEYHLYIDNKRIVRVYDANSPGVPVYLRETIKLILALPGDLYELPEFS